MLRGKGSGWGEECVWVGGGGEEVVWGVEGRVECEGYRNISFAVCHFYPESYKLRVWLILLIKYKK